MAERFNEISFGDASIRSLKFNNLQIFCKRPENYFGFVCSFQGVEALWENVYGWSRW